MVAGIADRNYNTPSANEPMKSLTEKKLRVELVELYTTIERSLADLYFGLLQAIALCVNC